ncbi:hypothetical protein [Klebsiella michiganensis]
MAERCFCSERHIRTLLRLSGGGLPESLVLMQTV